MTEQSEVDINPSILMQFITTDNEVSVDIQTIGIPDSAIPGLLEEVLAQIKANNVEKLDE